MNVIHDLSSRIADALPADSGARERALAVIQESYPWVILDEFEQAIGWYLAASPDIVNALLQLVDGPTLANLANEVAGDEHFCAVNVEPSQAANLLLELLGAPTIVWDRYYRGAHRIRAHASAEEQRFIRLRRSRRRLRGDELAHFGIVIWKYVETLLKVCARFYYNALYEEDKSAVSKALRDLGQSKTLGQILSAIWKLERAMKSDEQAKRRCLSLLERASPFQGLLDQPHTLDLTTKESEWQAQYARHLQEHQEQMGQEFVGPYWAEVFMADVQVYRNFYAHENDDVALVSGIDKAASSFEAAKRMLDHMLSEQVAYGDLVPQLVVPIERGIDHLGRETLKLVTDSDLNDDGTTYHSPVTIYRLAEWDKNLADVQLFRFYLCCPVIELALNPVLVPLGDIRPETLEEEE